MGSPDTRRPGTGDGVRTRLVIGGIALLLVAGIAGWGIAGAPLPGANGDDSDESGDQSQAVGVHVATVAERTVPIALRYTAVAKSPEIVELQARVTGQILQRPFRPGTTVAKGDLLFQIDERPFAAALAQDTAQRAAAAAQQRFYAAEVDRYSQLHEHGFASQERMQQAVRNRDNAQATINAAEARMMADRLDIEFARVRAPFDGRAGITDVNVGDVVTANQSRLVGLASQDPIDVQVAVSTEDLTTIRDATSRGEAPKLELLDDRGRPTGRQATIDEYDDSADPRTARLLVRARMANPKHDIAPGEFLRVRIGIGEQRKLLVPTVALSSDLDQQIVFAVRNGSVTEVPVETGDTFGDDTAILSGLDAGETIATDNIQRLHGGQKVQVKKGDPNGDPNAATG